jgi:hypothetical protein
MVEETERPEARPAAAQPRRRRGWVSLYAVSFVLLVSAAGAIGASSLGSLRSFALLWMSICLSVGAIAVAVVAVLLPRRP